MQPPDKLAPADPAPDAAPLFPRPPDARDLRAQAARAEAAERRRIGFKLRQALARDEFVLHYQPRIHLASGLVRGAEALIRLPHRRRGLIAPAHFIPVAERSDLINDIGAWVLRAACQEASLWPARFSIAVNISARQLGGGKLIKQAIEALAAADIPASRLELELTETMLVDRSEDTAFSLNAVRALGIGLSLDDFGTGYASLALLKRLPLTAIKLDRSLVRDLPQDHEGMVIAKAAIEAGHALGFVMVAEGVETQAQRDCLAAIGCDEAQGYLFGHPMPAPALRELLTKA